MMRTAAAKLASTCMTLAALSLSAPAAAETFRVTIPADAAPGLYEGRMILVIGQPGDDPAKPGEIAISLDKVNPPITPLADTEWIVTSSSAVRR